VAVLFSASDDGLLPSVAPVRTLRRVIHMPTTKCMSRYRTGCVSPKLLAMSQRGIIHMFDSSASVGMMARIWCLISVGRLIKLGLAVVLPFEREVDAAERSFGSFFQTRCSLWTRLPEEFSIVQACSVALEGWMFKGK
jgi:hypothetical protein